MQRGGRMNFSMEFFPSIKAISVTRRFVTDLAIECLHDADLAARVALVAHELLENSLKYSVDGAASLTIDVSPADDTNMRSVSVGVWCRGQASHTDTLRRALDEIAAAEDPSAYYLSAMRRSAKRASGSGLGLARIRAEGEMDLTGDFEGDGVCVRARATVSEVEP